MAFGRSIRNGAIVAVCVAGLSSGANASPNLSHSGSRADVSLPLARPDWPIPSDDNMVFFIQRSMNPNTVVYTARFDASGNLGHNPVQAYWRRYAEHGQTRALKLFERAFAYGVKTHANSDDKNWTVRFAALSDLSAELRQSGPNQAALWAHINNREYKLIYGYLDLDESGLFTRVIRLRLYTFDPSSNKYVTHLISVSGGDIRE